MKETKGSIITKLCAVAAFIIFIIGGGAIMYGSFFAEDWWRFVIGCCMLAIGFFLMGVLGQLIMRYERVKSLDGLSPIDCIKAGFMVMFLASSIVFFGIGIILWISDGMWILGVSAIGVLVVMIIVAIEISIDFQTNGATKSVMRDANATEHSGTVVAIRPRFPIMLLLKTVHLFYEYRVEVNGVKSSAFLKRGNRLRKNLSEGSKVTVKFNPQRPRNCAIIEVR